jgi:nucleoside-diphosphate-sugar epimerase
MLRWIRAYDESKFRAHEVALDRIGRGQPIVVVMPGQVYGPGDHSAAGAALREAAYGRLRYLAFPTLGMALGHVEDIAAGIVGALDRARVGESYVVAGPCVRIAEAIRIAAGVNGRRPPRMTLPTGVIRVLARMGPRVAAIAGQPPDLGEVIRAADGVTYWASAAKATRELGFSARDLERGLRETFAEA